jgi:Flp pilus assembly pilin Flp
LRAQARGAESHAPFNKELSGEADCLRREVAKMRKISMNSLKHRIAVLRHRYLELDESGQGLVEYTLLLTLISLATVTALTGMSGALSGQLTNLTSSL